MNKPQNLILTNMNLGVMETPIMKKKVQVMESALVISPMKLLKKDLKMIKQSILTLIGLAENLIKTFQPIIFQL